MPTNGMPQKVCGFHSGMLPPRTWAKPHCRHGTNCACRSCDAAESMRLPSENSTSRLGELDIDGSRIEIHRVPGAFELPVAAKALARTHRFMSIICLGCIVRGDTPHFDYVAGEAARGIQNVALEEMIPCIFGVLTVNTEEQARERVGGKHGHYGERAADSACEMMAMMARIRR